MFPFALLDVLATAKGPGDGGIGFAHFFAGVAAAGFDGCGGGNGPVAIAAVVGVEVGGRFFAVTERLCVRRSI